MQSILKVLGCSFQCHCWVLEMLYWTVRLYTLRFGKLQEMNFQSRFRSHRGVDWILVLIYFGAFRKQCLSLSPGSHEWHLVWKMQPHILVISCEDRGHTVADHGLTREGDWIRAKSQGPVGKNISSPFWSFLLSQKLNLVSSLLAPGEIEWFIGLGRTNWAYLGHSHLLHGGNELPSGEKCSPWFFGGRLAPSTRLRALHGQARLGARFPRTSLPSLLRKQ